MTNFSWPDGKRGAISLSFDDARLSQADCGLALLDEHRVNATFYVSFGALEDRLEVWRAAAGNGHEIGNHTISHPCSGNFAWARGNALEEYSLARMEDELTGANRKIEALLGITPSTFAYPCGQTFVGRGENFQSYVPLVAKHFRAGRGFNGEAVNAPEFCDLAHLCGVDADDKPFAYLKNWVDQTVESGGWLILCGHEIGAPKYQTVHVDALAALCEYCRDRNLWLDTVANVAAHVQTARQTNINL